MLFNQIYDDYIKARKERDSKKIEFLGFLRSELSNYAKDIKKDKLSDSEVIKILKKQHKKLKDTAKYSQDSNRTDIQKNLQFELNILEAYLPQPLSQTEINQAIDKAIAESQASSLADMGKIMKIILEEVGTRADPQYISKTVKEKLSS